MQIRILIQKRLVPMVYVEIPRSDLADFVFTSRIVTLCLTYERYVPYKKSHIAYVFHAGLFCKREIQVGLGDYFAHCHAMPHLQEVDGS